MRLIVVTQPAYTTDGDEARLRATEVRPDGDALTLPETTYLALLLHRPEAPTPEALGVGEEWWPLDFLAPGWWVARDPLTEESVPVRFGDLPEHAPTLWLRPSFRNRFGVCPLRVLAGETEQAAGTLRLTTSKATEEQLGRMLTYLWERQAHWFDAQTRAGVEHLPPPDSVLGTLARLRADLGVLHRQQPLFRLMPQTRLSPVRLRVARPRPDQLTESALAWALAHPYCLEPAVDVFDGEMDTLRGQGLAYRLTEVETDLLRENTDTPENRLLHGYLHDVTRYLSALPERLATDSPPPGADWQRDLLTRRVTAEVNRLLGLANDWQRFADEFLPVSRPDFLLSPLLTGFDYGDHYRLAGRLIRTWFDSGRAVGLEGTPALVGVRSVDKLYELFCLHRWLDAWQALGYSWESFAPTGDEPDRGLYHLRHPAGHRAVVAYECLPPGYRITVPYHRAMPLRPDFLLEWLPADGPAQYLIADAKFRPAGPVRENDLPNLVLRYVHGIAPERPAGRPVPLNRGLVLLHPAPPPNRTSGRQGYWFWHFPRFDWFGEQPADVQVGQIAVAVDASDENLMALLRRWVENSPL
jgi:hypothetical protein